MTETPTERRLREMADVMHDMNGEAIDKGRQAISILRRAFADHDEGREDERGTLQAEARALLTACQED